MATEAQKEANRRNAQKSTGPRTIIGKARVSRNATQHGLCSTVAVMSGENREEFEQILNDLNEEHQPQGTTEAILVYKMAVSFLSSWRAQILLTERLDINDTQDDSKQVALMLRYYNSSDRSFNKNLHDLRNLQKERRQEEIGFVPQIIPPIVPAPPDPISPDPEIQPDGGFLSQKITVEPPKKAA